MIEERDANPTADTPGRFRSRRAPTALTAGGTESSEVVARLSGTESSNPLPSSAESLANPIDVSTPVIAGQLLSSRGEKTALRDLPAGGSTDRSLGSAAHR